MNAFYSEAVALSSRRRLSHQRVRMQVPDWAWVPAVSWLQAPMPVQPQQAPSVPAQQPEPQEPKPAPPPAQAARQA